MLLRKPVSKRSSYWTKWLLLLVLITTITSCDKSDPVEEVIEDIPTDESMFNRLITVTNFGEALPEGAAPDSEQTPIYFSLEQNQAVNQTYTRTNRWDISFAYVYRTSLGGNNGANKSNFGYGGPGTGGILILEKSFDEVIDIPINGNFKTISDGIGPDHNGDFGYSVGWYLYDFGGIQVRDGAFDNQHIAYALDRDLEITTLAGEKKVVGPRTVIVRTARGNYAKIRFLSIYKDKLDRDSWKRNDEKPYFTFDYVLAKAGSTKFEINN